MVDAKFDQSGKIENLDELTTEEVADAYFAHSQKVFGRAKSAEDKVLAEKEAREKAESELKSEREKNAQKKPDVDSDELRLLAKGLSDEEVDEAKAIAKGRDISLAEAIKTKSFQLFQDNLKDEARKEKAKLNASKGSGEGGADDEDVVKPDMTREDHQKLFKKALGK